MTADAQAERERLTQLALQCLKDAIKAGFDDFETMREDSDLKSLHKLPEFQALLPAQ